MEILQPPEQPTPFNEPERLKAGEGVTWFTDAWKIFNRNRFSWMGAIVLTFIISIIPVILIILAMGDNILDDSDNFSATNIMINLLTTWISYCFIGSFMMICHQTAQGKDFNFGTLFTGFSSKKAGAFLVLLLLGVVFALLLALVFIIPLFLLSGGNFSAVNPQAFVTTLPLLLVIALFVTAVFCMTFWLTPALIMLEDMEPFAAMKTSFNACRRNIPALLVYGLIWIGVGIAVWTIFTLIVIQSIGAGAAVNPSNNAIVAGTSVIVVFLISYLILYPLAIIGMYTSYRSIFPKGRLNRQ